MRFLALTKSSRIPDSKTIWFYRDKLSKGNTAEELFKKFDEQIQKSGLVTHEETLIGATFDEGSTTKKQRGQKQSDKER